MNERIKELAEQACPLFKQFYVVGSWRAEEIEEFAELIVKECASIYSKIDNGNRHLGTDDYLEALQKHFGVE